MTSSPPDEGMSDDYVQGVKTGMAMRPTSPPERHKSPWRDISRVVSSEELLAFAAWCERQNIFPAKLMYSKFAELGEEFSWPQVLQMWMEATDER